MSCVAGSTTIRPSRTRFHGLDAIRGLAAVFVATLHIPFLTAKLWLPESILAVDLFFCLSGVVLAEAYKQELGDGMSWRTYMMLRLVRLYPFYLLSLGLSSIIAMMRLSGGEAAFLLLLAVFLLPCAGPASFPLNGPAWSLCDELIASAAYGIVVKLRRPSLPFAMALVFAFGLLAYCFLLEAKGLNFGADVYTFPGGLLRVAFLFLRERSYVPSTTQHENVGRRSVSATSRHVSCFCSSRQSSQCNLARISGSCMSSRRFF